MLCLFKNRGQSTRSAFGLAWDSPITRLGELAVRIIGGKHRGRKIKQPGFDTVRPTKDRVRESIFNIIAVDVPGSRVLDMFAGSGAYGLEALSRGAENAVFVEKDSRCCGVIKENAEFLGEEGDIRIITADIFKNSELLGEYKEGFDLVFADPPYNVGMARKVLIMINHYDILSPSGLLILEHYRKEGVHGAERSLCARVQKAYGDVHVSIYTRRV